MSQKSDDINPFDPTGMFKSMRDTRHGRLVEDDDPGRRQRCLCADERRHARRLADKLRAVPQGHRDNDDPGAHPAQYAHALATSPVLPSA